jgi:hypothetical protein
MSRLFLKRNKVKLTQSQEGSDRAEPANRGRDVCGERKFAEPRGPGHGGYKRVLLSSVITEAMAGDVQDDKQQD